MGCKCSSCCEKDNFESKSKPLSLSHEILRGKNLAEFIIERNTIEKHQEKHHEKDKSSFFPSVNDETQPFDQRKNFESLETKGFFFKKFRFFIFKKNRIF